MANIKLSKHSNFIGLSNKCIVRMLKQFYLISLWMSGEIWQMCFMATVVKKFSNSDRMGFILGFGWNKFTAMVSTSEFHSIIRTHVINSSITI